MSDPLNPLPTGSPLPEDAQRMGLTPLTAPELALASALRPEKRLHRIAAWVLLLLILAPVLLAIFMR